MKNNRLSFTGFKNDNIKRRKEKLGSRYERQAIKGWDVSQKNIGLSIEKKNKIPFKD